MDIYTYSEPGQGHDNEDAVLIQSHPGDSNTLLCALADGQGGQSGGAEAARLAVQESLKVAATFSPSMLLKESTWLRILSAADEAVEPRLPPDIRRSPVSASAVGGSAARPRGIVPPCCLTMGGNTC